MNFCREHRWQLGITLIFLAILSILFYFLLPLLPSIVLGFVFAYVARPIKKWFEREYDRRISAMIATAMVITPIALIFIFEIFEAINQFMWILNNLESFQNAIIDLLGSIGAPDFIRDYVAMNFPSFIERFRDFLPSLADVERTKSLMILVLNFFISIFVCYYLLIDGGKIYSFLLTLVPEERKEEMRRFMLRTDDMLSGLFIGNFFMSIIISLMSVPFFLFFKIPLVALLASLMFLAALIPIFAEWMVLLPVVLYVLINRGAGEALIIAISGSVYLYIFPEMILRPYFVAYTSGVNPALLLLAFIGGGLVGGVSGFFLAPTFLVIATAFYREFIYERCELPEGGD
ncbi:MAG: hypothetical protein PWR13_937 [Archaeoglobi archaeon]|nr:hypothetical protein [Archaeoglobi archaeon]MDK2781909.1 hypothetical protein [Archaeoglobi archaeon]